MLRMEKSIPEFCFLILLFTSHVDSDDLPSIRPVPCSNRMTGEFGVCTFNWSCINVAHGVHIGPCVDRFFVGTCCKIPQGTAEGEGEGEGSRKSHSYSYNSYSGTDTSSNGAGEGTRKVGEVPTHTQFHHTVAPKTQKEKLNGARPIHLIDIRHFNVSLNPADYYDYQYNVTSHSHYEQSSKSNNATHSEQDPPMDHRNFSSSSSTQKQTPSASFFYTLLFSNYTKPGPNKESLNKTVDSVITLLGNNNSSSMHSFSSTSHAIKPTTSIPVGSPYTWRTPIAVHNSHDQRKPVSYDTSHDLRKPVTLHHSYDARKPLIPQNKHDLRNPVAFEEEAHDLRWPVLDEEDHDQRLPVPNEETHHLRLPIIQEESHDKRWSGLSDDNRLSIEHLFKWIGNHYSNSNMLSANPGYASIIPTSDIKTTPISTNIILATKPPSLEESIVLNFGMGEEISIKATTATENPSQGSTTIALSNFTLFVRPTSSRPSYKPFQQLPEQKPTETKIILNDSSQVCGISRSGTTARIVGGIKSHYLRWPWMVSLRRLDGKSYKHKCGATLLNRYWAITAAHCVDGKHPTDIILRLGEYNFRRADEMHPHVERRIYVMVIHPEFDHITYENDLALLRFQEPVKLQANIVPVCLPHYLDDITGRIAVVTGWGRLAEDGELPTSLHEVHLPIISNKECEQMYYEAGYAEKIKPVFVCAGISDGGLDACEGDSGGPMVVRGDKSEWVLVGLISWGMGCAAPKQPGVYTRISKFTDWIEGIIAH